jgi:hypothetical protein
MRADGRVACDVFEFINNERVTGTDEELTWQASHALALKQSLLGIWDAGRKARPCSQKPGAWAGAIVHVVSELGVCVLISIEKWSKLRAILEKWSAVLLDNKGREQPRLAHKELLSDRGFLVYVTRTYLAMVPYLKGFHLTIEVWRGGQDAEGWKLPVKDDNLVASGWCLDATRAGGYGMDLSLLASYSVEHAGDQDEASANHWTNLKAGHDMLHAPRDGFTTPVPCFKDDIAALTRLTDFDLPPLRGVRPTHVVQVLYGFGNASGKQFGATLSKNDKCRGCLSKMAAGSSSIWFWVGLWSPKEEEESSNYKELRNLVDAVGEEAKAERLRDCELFIFTESLTAEGCFYRGNSKSVRLHALVLELQTLEMTYGRTLHVVHILGKRIITQGTDGCLQGLLMEGVMAGQDMLSFIDLACSAVEHHPPVLT